MKIKKPSARRIEYALTAIFFVASGAASAATDAKESSLVYTIRPGDKLIRLGQEMLVSPASWQEVAQYNHLDKAASVRVGQQLNIPLRLLKSQPAGGKLLSVSGDVQVGGAPAKVGSTVAEGSRVQTGANSSAVVELGDGSQVKLLPSSLAEVVTNRNYAMRDASASSSTNWFSGIVRLAQGSLETLASKGKSRATPLQIQTATSTLGVRGTQFRVAMDDPAGQNSRSEVIEGLVRADNTAQQSGAELPMGTGAVINPKEKEVKVVKLLGAPDVSGMQAEQFKPQVQLAWAALPGASAYRVQVASDAGFNQIVREYRVAGTQAALGDLPSSNWYTRVRGIDAQGLEGFDAVKLVAVRDAVPVPVVLWQATNPRLAFADGKTLLVWQARQPGGAPVAASGYRIELARDRGFSSGVQNIQSSESSAVLGSLQPGAYFVRIQATLANGGSQPSETYRFELPGNWGSTVLDVAAALRSE